MKIACVGNMNNCMFPIARILADHGHTVTLFLLDEYEHFLPSADVFEQDTRIEIINLGWNHQNFYLVRPDEIKKLFAPFNFFIATDYAPAYFLKARMAIDLFFPAGGDILDYPFRKIKSPGWLPEIFRIESQRCTWYQRWGLSLVGCLSMDPSTVEFENCLRTLKMNKIERIPALPFLYMAQYTETYFSRSAYYARIQALRQENEFLLIQHSRQSWVMGPSSLDYKGNDLLIKGFHLFVKNNPGKTCKLLLFEYGFDVEPSKKLIGDLGLTDYVVWFPTMPRKDLLSIIRFCDVGVGELGHSWFSYGAVYEILAMGVVFMGKRKDSDYAARFPELYPMLNASTEQEVFRWLNEMPQDREAYRRKGKEANEWFTRYAIDRSVDLILKKVSGEGPVRKASSIGLSLKVKLFLADTYTAIIVLLNRIKLKSSRLMTLQPK